MSFIEITGLYKYYGVGQNRVAALKNINLKIEGDKSRLIHAD